MRAAVCFEFGQPLVIEDVVIDPPQTGEVLVRITATAICHSDIHLLRGELGGDVPVVTGHESAGVVESVGPGVTRVQSGDRVVVSLLRSCGSCFYCVIGSPQLCAGKEAFPLATENRLHLRSGEPIGQGAWVGGFAEYAVVHESQLVIVDADMPLDRACLLACGVITGLGAVVNTARVRVGSSVVVIGVGGVGVNAVQGAVLAGAKAIIALDPVESKREGARQFGATHALDSNRTDLVEAIAALTDSRGADYAIVTVGNAAAIEQGWAVIRPGGTVVAVGLPKVGDLIRIPAIEAAITEKRLLGSMMGSTRLSVDVPRLVELYRQGRLKLDELITARYPLEQINGGIAAVERGEALRNVIVFG
jgi:S-(hydroxymethyl)glutathione dehydrogenase/alcohol dehydrogenase